MFFSLRISSYSGKVRPKKKKLAIPTRFALKVNARIHVHGAMLFTLKGMSKQPQEDLGDII